MVVCLNCYVMMYQLITACLQPSGGGEAETLFCSSDQSGVAFCCSQLAHKIAGLDPRIT
jgi:hypothetical protein